MNILVTGGLGFIGSNFINYQIDNYSNKILNYDNLSYAANLANLDRCKNNSLYSFIKGDICDKKKLSTCINNFQPDYIINFAAESHVDRSIDNPEKFIKTNIFGTFTLLETALDYWKKQIDEKNKNFRFLHISTDEVYGSLGNTGSFKETTAYNPSSPYSASKASSDHLVNAWGHTFGLPTLITNCSNNYGPFQFPEKLIPLIIINCLNGNPLPIYGDGKNIRDWLHVKDHCDAIYKILQCGAIGETYNIGGNEEKTNIEIVMQICKILDAKKPLKKSSYKDLITYVKDRAGHDFRYAIDASKIKNEINWSPFYTFEKGLEETVDWYINNEEWWKNILNKNYNLERLGNY